MTVLDAPFPAKTRPTARLVLGAVAAFCVLEWLIARATYDSPRPMLLAGIGVAIGATLFGTNFGFSSAFRRAAISGDLRVFGAHALMLGLASLLIVPMVQAGSVLGYPVTGFATPIGVSFVTGAALFGIGMQLSGGCASGTLYLLGGGNLKFAGTLVTFVIGSAVGAAHIGFWRGLPSFAPFTVFSMGDWTIGLEFMLMGFGGVAAAATQWRGANPAPFARPLVVGAVILALLNAATVVVAGRPWTETFGFALWGSKLAATLGFHPENWVFWQNSDALGSSIFADTTSIMDLSIILGAFLAGAVTRRFRTVAGGSATSWLAALLGGLMMGYGARLSGGCNIGAYFSALASGDFSGWVWALVALATTGIGGYARRRLDGTMGVS